MQLNQVKKIRHKAAALRQSLKSLILSSRKHKVSRLHCRDSGGLMHEYLWYFLFSSRGIPALSRAFRYLTQGSESHFGSGMPKLYSLMQ